MLIDKNQENMENLKKINMTCINTTSQRVPRFCFPGYALLDFYYVYIQI